MFSIYRRLKVAATNGFHWWLDYLYVAFWQVRAAIIPTNIIKYRGGSDEKPAVIIIPGIYETWQFMKPLADVIDKRGYRLHVVTRLGRNSQDIEVSAAVVEQYIAEHQLGPYLIVAHSKGGLIGKYVMGGAQGEQCIGMIAINSPFNGSLYARAFLFGPLKMFSPTSAIIRRLLSQKDINGKIISVYGQFDPHIPGGSKLEGATNIQLAVRGHFKVLRNKLVKQAVVDGLETLSGQSSATR